MGDTSNLTVVAQYLTFNLDKEIYAFNVHQIREVLDYTSITKVPRTPDFMSGVINLRGRVVPVIDLRIKFGLPAKEVTVDTSIVVIEVVIDEEEAVIGVLVDSVHQVKEILPENIEPPPSIGSRIRIEFIKGMGKQEESDQFIIILNLDEIFTSDELNMISQSSGTDQKKETE